MPIPRHVAAVLPLAALLLAGCTASRPTTGIAGTYRITTFIGPGNADQPVNLLADSAEGALRLTLRPDGTAHTVWDAPSPWGDGGRSAGTYTLQPGPNGAAVTLDVHPLASELRYGGPWLYDAAAGTLSFSRGGRAYVQLVLTRTDAER